MQSYQQAKRRKKRVLHAGVTKTVTVVRGKLGYGFTISGQNPCVLSSIVAGSPAQLAGLKAGDLLYFVNGQNVSKACHDDVVRMVGLSTGSLELQVAENYNSSDSSDDDYLPRTKSRYPNRVRSRHSLGEKGSKADRGSPSPGLVKQINVESLPQCHQPDEESDLSSSFTSHEDQFWSVPQKTVSGMYIPGQASFRLEKKQISAPSIHSRPRNDLARSSSSVHGHTIVSTARKVTLAAAVVKRLPPVVDSGKQPRQTGTHQQTLSGTTTNIQVSNKDIAPKSEQLYSHPPTHDKENKTQKAERRTADNPVKNLKAVVGYMGSIEIPNSYTYPHQRLQALRNAVRRVRMEKRIHTLVQMEVKTSGVFLVNAIGKQVAVYPSDHIAFTGICPDDERFFGLVTTSVAEPNYENVNKGVVEFSSKPNSTCHIFMIDPDLSLHSVHAQQARAFQVACLTGPQSSLCAQFPRSATSLILAISDLYRDRPSSSLDSGLVQSLALTDLVSRSQQGGSSSDSGVGLGREESAEERHGQVCVVEMSPTGREQLDVSAMDTSIVSMQHLLFPEVVTPETPGRRPASSLNNSATCEEQCCPFSEPLHKLTAQAMLEPTGSEAEKTKSSERRPTTKSKGGVKQNIIQRLQQSRKQLLKEENSGHARVRAEECCSDENMLSLSVSEDGQALLESGRSSQWPGASHGFVIPTKPPPNSIHHTAGKSAFHVIRSTSVPVGKQRQPETVELDLVAKLSPRVFADSPLPSPAVFRSPSAPPAPCFPHRDYDEDGSDSEDDPYIHQMLKKSGTPAGFSAEENQRRFSEGFALLRKQHTETVGFGSIQKWTARGSFRKPEAANLKLSFTQSLESLAVGEDGNTAAQKLMTACSVHNIARNVQSGAVSAGRVASWAVHFHKLLQDPQGMSVFTEFLEKEFSDENIRFWKACQQFHELMSEHQRKVQAKEIYMQYLAPSASDPVNVDTTARSYTEKFLDSPAAIMFDVAQQQIFQLMKQDSYPRFLKSDLYKKMLTQELEHKSSSSQGMSGGEAAVGKDQSSEKENVGKRRRSILPWKHYQKSIKGVSESDLKKVSKKGKVGVPASASSNHLSVGVSYSGATPTSSLSSSSRHSSSQPTLGVSNQDSASASTTSLSNAARNSQGALAKKSAGFGIDLSTMRKEVFQQKEVQGCPEPEVKFCRIIMPDGSTTVVCAKPGQTCRAVLSKLCEKRSLSIGSVDVFLLGSDKILDLNEDISVLGSKEIVIEKRVVFRLDLSEGKCVGAKAKPNRTIRDVLKPILQKYGYAVDNICVQMTSNQQTIDLDMPVTKLDNQRITILSDRTGTAQKHASKAAMFGLFGTSEKRILEDRKQNQGKV